LGGRRPHAAHRAQRQRAAPGLARDLEELDKTVWEVEQRTVRGMAADRGAYIDQSRSLSIHMVDAATARLSSMHSHGWQLELKTGRYHLVAIHVPSNFTALPMTPLLPADLRDEVAGGEPAHRRLAAARW
jgi:ribonucleotide reductase alpha subunit